ncbi:MAG: peptide chain release factor 2 [Candidatus Cloacimonadota bacterium]|nr:MAG: peptide chain release factor 2 [Candidatus Cloacimonadota bacterium]
MEYIDFQKEVQKISDKIFYIRGYFDTALIEQTLQKYEKEMNDPNFWNDQKHAQKVTREINTLRLQLDKEKKLKQIDEDLNTFLLMLDEDFNENLFSDAVEELKENSKFIDEVEAQFLLNGKTDSNSAIVTIHPGAGGTESQDWAEMLLRMYKRWAEKCKHKVEIVDLQPGDEAGIKSVTMEIIGDFAYGMLKAESGIHRLVRISPFNAQGKRQTSFASVFSYPIIDDDVDIEIDPKDLRIDTYRASGKGGQGVNTTDSAVRITHIPTNIVVQCQNERSQIINKDVAMKILKSRLYQQREEEREKERKKLENAKTEIGWGNQIRSYVFHPYQMVKDHRTNFETGNISSVMDGDLNDFMNAYLKFRAEQK